MTRFSTGFAFPVAIALGLAAPTGTANAVPAAQPAYVATFADAPSADRFVTRNLVWNCKISTCATSRTSPSRDSIVCKLAVKQAGPVVAFSVKGQAFDAAAIAECNTAAE